VASRRECAGERLTLRPAVFLDRDGVLNELVYYPDYGEDESPRRPGDLRLLPGVVGVLGALMDAGWALVVVSNQPSYAKGKTALENLKAVHKALAQELKAGGVVLTDARYSYTHPRGVVPDYTTASMYRKPNPGLVYEAARDHQLALRTSWFIGDRDTDIQCGQAAGTRTALVQYPLSADKQGASTPDLTVPDLLTFAQHILNP
jgi:D-glycero-D-manno-heptose 1,7-bisphosphate phosphatase